MGCLGPSRVAARCFGRHLGVLVQNGDVMKMKMVQ